MLPYSVYVKSFLLEEKEASGTVICDHGVKKPVLVGNACEAVSAENGEVVL